MDRSWKGKNELEMMATEDYLLYIYIYALSLFLCKIPLCDEKIATAKVHLDP